MDLESLAACPQSIVESIMSWPVAAWLLFLVVASAINIRFRVDVEESLGWKDVHLPEKQWNYEAQGLREFVKDAGGADSASLNKYLRVLRFSDIWFAIALSGSTACLWYQIATLSPLPCLQWAYPYLAWLAAPLGAMALIYGVSDVAEDMKLAKILRDGDRIDPAEAAAANLLTRIKIVSLGASGIGYALFLPIGWVHDIYTRVRKGRPIPAARG